MKIRVVKFDTCRYTKVIEVDTLENAHHVGEMIDVDDMDLDKDFIDESVIIEEVEE